jgi:hypothetical protein
MQTNQGYVVSGTLPTRIDKALAWLERSRNTWKEKCRQTKLLLKRQTFATKRLKEGRNVWKLSTLHLKQELSESKEIISVLQQHIKKLESQVEIFRNENAELKKKSSRMM